MNWRMKGRGKTEGSRVVAAGAASQFFISFYWQQQPPPGYCRDSLALAAEAAVLCFLRRGKKLGCTERSAEKWKESAM